ncbi:hypothetical protein FRC11_002014 [Ceratobasidium sp. 423]|nr:hypothetical protein FRC11_002014 [Ceratobasidium sp. 423]
MELHAEARTSFITYWLPNLSKHTHIALRFLPQDQYEASAPLHVIPAPNITTRVFMLFMGVQEVDLGAWKAAQVPAQEWSRIVGVDRAKAKDPPAKRQRIGSFDTKNRVWGTSPFIMVEYNGRKVAIPRDSDYDVGRDRFPAEVPTLLICYYPNFSPKKTVKYIKRVFRDLEDFGDSGIMLIVKLERIDDSAEVVKALWPDMVLQLALLKVVIQGALREIELQLL